MPNYKIQITAEDIDSAVRKSSSHCAIAAAIEAEVGGATYISVDIQTIRFSVGNSRYVFLTPRKAQKCILDFDAGLRPKPFQLNLTNPQEINRNKKEKATLKKERGRDGHIPKIVGGKAPPKFRSTRREFGIRAFDYPSE